MKISHLHPEHPTETVIQIEGLRQFVTLMPITTVLCWLNTLFGLTNLIRLRSSI